VGAAPRGDGTLDRPPHRAEGGAPTKDSADRAEGGAPTKNSADRAEATLPQEIWQPWQGCGSRALAAMGRLIECRIAPRAALPQKIQQIGPRRPSHKKSASRGQGCGSRALAAIGPWCKGCACLQAASGRGRPSHKKASRPPAGVWEPRPRGDGALHRTLHRAEGGAPTKDPADRVEAALLQVGVWGSAWLWA